MLSTKSYVNLVRRARNKGYRVHLIFFWLESPEQEKALRNENVVVYTEEQGIQHIPARQIIAENAMYQ